MLSYLGAGAVARGDELAALGAREAEPARVRGFTESALQLVVLILRAGRLLGEMVLVQNVPGNLLRQCEETRVGADRVGGLAGSSISRSRASLSATQWLRSSQSVRPVPMKMSPARDMAYAFAGMPRFLEAEKLYTAVITSED